MRDRGGAEQVEVLRVQRDADKLARGGSDQDDERRLVTELIVLKPTSTSALSKPRERAPRGAAQ